MRQLLSLALWLVTACLTALLIGTVKIYQVKGNFTSVDKASFYTLTLILTFLLELNFLKSFEGLAKALRPTLLKWAKGDREEQQLLETAASLSSFSKLWWISWRRSTFKIAVFCAAWISLNIVAGLIVAATNLTYTVNDGTNSNDTYVNRGIVDVTDLSCYHMEHAPKGCPNQVAIQSVSHAYGEMILAFESGPYNDPADILRYKHVYRYFHRGNPDQMQVTYRFNEYNPSDTEQVFPYLTNRTISAEARNCITYTQKDSDTSKDPQNLTYVNDLDAADIGSIQIPQDFLGREGTTYIYRGFHDPTQAALQSCGPRCVYMWAYRNPSGFPIENPEPPAFFKCPVNISEVYNSSQPEHEVPDTVAKMAAASIALHGGYVGPPGDESKKDYSAYRFYANGSPWDIHHPLIPSASYVGDRFALFALGSLANMATLNPQIQIPGRVPYLGHSAAMNEPWFAIVWACIVGAHLGVLVAVVLLGEFGRAAQRENRGLELGARGSSQVALVQEDGNGGQQRSEASEQEPIVGQENAHMEPSDLGEQGPWRRMSHDTWSLWSLTSQKNRANGGN